MWCNSKINLHVISKNSIMPYLFLFLAALLLCACDPCRNLDCVTDNYDGQFRIVSAATGDDLLFGSTAMFTKDDIRFFAWHGSDTIVFSSQAMYASGNGYDSVLQVRFYPKTDTAYMQLGNSALDTLQMSFRTYNTRCCGTITEITNFRINNKVDLPGKGIQEVKK